MGYWLRNPIVYSFLKEEYKLLPMNYNDGAKHFLPKIPPTWTAGPGEINLELTGEISSVLSAGMFYVDY